MIALPRRVAAWKGAWALHFEASRTLFSHAASAPFALVMHTRLCFSDPFSNLPKHYETTSICPDLRRAVGPRRLQFDERSGAACVEARDSCFVGAARIGYIELSATHDSVGADETRPGIDGVAGRVQCVARDAHTFGVWLDREGPTVFERRWRRAGTGIALRYREVHDLRDGSASTRRSANAKSKMELKSKTPQVSRLAGFSVSWRRGWDSNPRYGKTVRLISSQVHSTTLPPLRLPTALRFRSTSISLH